MGQLRQWDQQLSLITRSLRTTADPRPPSEREGDRWPLRHRDGEELEAQQLSCVDGVERGEDSEQTGARWRWLITSAAAAGRAREGERRWGNCTERSPPFLPFPK